MLNSDLRAELVEPAAGRLTVAVIASQAGEVDAMNVAAPPIALEAAWGDVEFKHRLLMIVPIVPFLLNYEGEVELKSRLGLDAVWQALATKIRWR